MAPLATSYLYGWDAERAIQLAVEEINAGGGVMVGGQKRPFKIETIDTRDLEPGVPVSEALLAVEKLILEKKADFIVLDKSPLDDIHHIMLEKEIYKGGRIIN